MNEGQMYQLLKARVCRDSGNGPQAILVPQVRNSAGFGATRTLDAVSLGFWPSRGMELEGFEIKVSRADWLRELKDPSKMDSFAGLLDRVWLVVSDRKIVLDGELPPGWGLLYKHGNGLRQQVAAEKLHELGKGELPPEFNRHFLVPLLRATMAVDPGHAEQLRRERAAARDHGASEARREVDLLQGELRRYKERVEAFTEASGVNPLAEQDWLQGTPEERGRAFKVLMQGETDLKRTRTQAQSIQRQAQSIVDAAKKIAEGEGDDEEML